jgi:hypothetical protein
MWVARQQVAGKEVVSSGRIRATREHQLAQPLAGFWRDSGGSGCSRGSIRPVTKKESKHTLMMTNAHVHVADVLAVWTQWRRLTTRH